MYYSVYHKSYYDALWYSSNAFVVLQSCTGSSLCVYYITVFWFWALRKLCHGPDRIVFFLFLNFFFFHLSVKSVAVRQAQWCAALHHTYACMHLDVMHQIAQSVSDQSAADLTLMSFNHHFRAEWMYAIFQW